MDKYDDKKNKKSENHNPAPSTKTKSQDVIDRCNMLISGVSVLQNKENPEKEGITKKRKTQCTQFTEIDKKQKVSEKAKPSPFSSDLFSTTVTSNDPRIFDVTEDSRYLGDTTVVERCSVEPVKNDKVPNSTCDLLMKKFMNVIDTGDESDEVDKEICNITLSMEENQENNVRNLTSVHMPRAYDDALHSGENLEDGHVILDSPHSNKSEELFNTDGDDDIVETTPQKPKIHFSQRL